MYYFLALLLPPLASHKCGRLHFPQCLACFILCFALPFFGRSLVLGLLALPVSAALLACSAVFAALDVRTYYREADVALIAEAIRRAQQAPAAPLPDCYDEGSDTWRID